MAKELTAKEKLTLERMKLMSSHRFFASILLHLNLIESSKDNEIESMGVSAKGDLFYNPKFILNLSSDELRGVLCHEVMHVVLRHLYRFPDRCNFHLWNIATDLVINDILVNIENIRLPNGHDNIEALIPDVNGKYVLEFPDLKPLKLTIRNRPSEAIYWEIYNYLKQNNKTQHIANGQKGEGGEEYRRSIGKGFDKHIFSQSEEDKENSKQNQSNSSSDNNSSYISEAEAEELDRKWSSVVAAANMEENTHSRATGNGWASRALSDFSAPQINWRVALHRYVREVLPYDCSWVKPSKRAYSTGVYSPIINKKPENIVVAIDVSGSISQDDLQLFVNEIYGILKAYTNIGVRVVFWSTKVDKEEDKVYKINDIKSILDVKPLSTGGTSISCVEEYLSDIYCKETAIVYITDGYVEDSPLFKCSNKKRLFIISSEGSDEILRNYGTTAKLKKERR